jgi:hypothetical protein
MPSVHHQAQDEIPRRGAHHLGFWLGVEWNKCKVGCGARLKGDVEGKGRRLCGKEGPQLFKNKVSTFLLARGE